MRANDEGREKNAFCKSEDLEMMEFVYLFTMYINNIYNNRSSFPFVLTFFFCIRVCVWRAIGLSWHSPFEMRFMSQGNRWK